MTPQTAGHLAMLAFSVLVAGSYALGGLAANLIAPEALNAVRFWIALCVVGAAMLATHGRPVAMWVAPWRYLLLGGMFVVFFVTMFEGLKTATPVSSAAIFTLTPVMSAIFGWMLMKQRITPWVALALTIGAIGALWVIFRADFGAFLRFDLGPGERIFFIGCAAHALYTPMVRKLNRGEPAIVFTFGTLVASALILTVWAAPTLVSTDWANLPRIVWITILYTSIFASSMTFVLLQFATLRLPSAKVMAYTYLTPAWVILWNVALGGTWPPVAVAAGVGLTGLALVMLLRPDGAQTG